MIAGLCALLVGAVVGIIADFSLGIRAPAAFWAWGVLTGWATLIAMAVTQ